MPAPGRTIDHYVNDGGSTCVAVSQFGGASAIAGGLFQLRGDEAGSLQWVYLYPGGSTRDPVPQGIFRSYRYYPVAETALPAGTPPVPPVPTGPFPDPLAGYLPAGPLGSADFPLLARELRAQSDQSAEVIIVLNEDRYDAAFGDGRFVYLLDAFLSEAEREAFLATGPGNRTHLRAMTLRMAGEVFEYPDFRHDPFDRHSVAGVLRKLEDHLGSQSGEPPQNAGKPARSG